MQSREERAAEIQHDIGEVLLRHWDPLGVADMSESADEYNAYVGGVYRLLASGASAREIADHLARVQADALGLTDIDPTVLIPVAEKLRQLNVRLGPLPEVAAERVPPQVPTRTMIALEDDDSPLPPYRIARDERIIGHTRFEHREGPPDHRARGVFREGAEYDTVAYVFHLGAEAEAFGSQVLRREFEQAREALNLVILRPDGRRADGEVEMIRREEHTFIIEARLRDASLA